MANNDATVRLQELNDALMALAMEAEDQIRWVGPAHPDELGLVFDDAVRLIPALELDGVVLTRQARTILGEINGRLDAMSGAEHAELWTDEAIRSDPHWAELRLLARRLLMLPTWPRADGGRS